MRAREIARVVVAQVRPLVGWVARRLMPDVEPAQVLPFALRWGKARARALMPPRGLVRGTMIVCPRPGRVWAMELDRPMPAAREVLVRVAVSAISPGTERAFFRHQPNARPTYPYFPGYSLAGEVVVAGRESQFRPGDRVAIAAPHASVAVAPDAQLYRVPPTVSLEEAAFVQLGIIALQAVQKAHLQRGGTVVVLGQGLIGQLLVQLSVAFGAYPVVSVARSDKRVLDSLRRTAQQVIVEDRDGRDALGRLGAEVTFDATGSPDGLPAALRSTREGGRIVLAGSTRGVTQQADFGLLADKAVTIVGAHVSSASRRERAAHAQMFLDLVRRRRLDVASLITERIHPLEAERFYRRLSRNDDATVGAVICWDRLHRAQLMRHVGYHSLPDLSPLQHTRMARWPLGRRAHATQDVISP